MQAFWTKTSIVGLTKGCRISPSPGFQLTSSLSWRNASMNQARISVSLGDRLRNAGNSQLNKSTERQRNSEIQPVLLLPLGFLILLCINFLVLVPKRQEPFERQKSYLIYLGHEQALIHDEGHEETIWLEQGTQGKWNLHWNQGQRMKG